MVNDLTDEIIAEHDRTSKFHGATLPKWAGDLIVSLAREIRDHRALSAALDARNARVVTRQRIGPKNDIVERPVGDDAVIFKCGEKYSEEIDVSFDYTAKREGRYVLRISSNGDALLIRPAGGVNVITVEPTRD